MLLRTESTLRSSCGSSRNTIAGTLRDLPADRHRRAMVHLDRFIGSRELLSREQPGEQEKAQKEMLGHVLNQD